MNNLEILYEDNHIIVAIKPFNVLSQSDITNDVDMLTMLKEYIKIKYNKPGNVYLGLVHRLDRPTKGIMVFAKTSKAAKRLSEQITNHQFNKKYLAVVNGIIKEDFGVLEDYLKKENKRAIITNKNDGKLSQLEYKVLKRNYEKKLTLVDINLITGRYNQIRCQFASYGFPLYGDSKYGKNINKQLCLIAYLLEFEHPVTKKIMTFKIEYDQDIDGFVTF